MQSAAPDPLVGGGWLSHPQELLPRSQSVGPRTQHTHALLLGVAYGLYGEADALKR